MNELTQYLQHIVESSRRCSHCANNQGDGKCEYDYECIYSDGLYYDEGDDDGKN